MGTIIATKPRMKRIMREATMRTITERHNETLERALVERRESAVLRMRLQLEELARRETLCRAEIVHHTQLLLRTLEEV